MANNKENITAIVNVLSVAKRASITEIANKANMPYAIAQVTVHSNMSDQSCRQDQGACLLNSF